MPFLAATCAAACMLLFGCSSPNSQNLIDPNTGKHAANWMTGDPIVHGATAEQDFSVCKSCHGDDYRGGIAKISCYGCHNGPGLNHPTPGWVVPLSSPTTTPFHKTDTAQCTKCHGADYLGGGSHIACIKCHLEGPTSVHVLSWGSTSAGVTNGHPDYVETHGTVKCQNGYCHGLPSLTADVWNGLSGPHCNGTCHSWPFNPTSLVCGSCHGIPPAGSQYPDVAGSHLVHTALTGTTLTGCSVCHNGTDGASGNPDHSNNVVEISVSPLYNAKTGTAAYDPASATCSQVSCHGGQATPNWLSGAIDVNTQCTLCHSYGTSQYNSYVSGQHYLHVLDPGNGPQPKLFCTDCHDTTLLAVSHFTSLSTPAMEGPASGTLNSSVQYDGTGCANSCHGGVWFSWQ